MAEPVHTTATTEHPQEGGFPPLDTSTFPTQIFWLVVTFAFLFTVVWRVAGPRINGVITSRRSAINSAIAEASKARAEKLVRASGIDWTIVRPPGIYGPRDTEYLEMFRLARWGVLPVPPKEGRSSLIHVDDLARLLLALLPASEEVMHRVYEPDDGRKQGWSHYELARTIGWAVGRRPWIIHLSRASLERVARADRFVRKHKAKLTLDRVGYMTHPDWVVTHGARPPSTLWRPLIPTRDGMQAAAQWYRDNGWL